MFPRNRSILALDGKTVNGYEPRRSLSEVKRRIAIGDGFRRRRREPARGAAAVRVHLPAVFAAAAGPLQGPSLDDRGRLQLLRRLAAGPPVPDGRRRVSAHHPAGHRAGHFRLKISGTMPSTLLLFRRRRR